MRWLALTLAVFLTGSPLAEALVSGGAPEPCPMAASMPDGTSCLTAPCPCNHSAPAVVAPQLPPSALSVTAAPAPPPDLSRDCPPAAAARPDAGFPFAIDHPPGQRG